MVEHEARHQIDKALEAKGWVLDPNDPEKNVFLGNAIKERLTPMKKQELGQLEPDYTFWGGGVP